MTLTHTANVTFVDTVPPAISVGSPADGVTAAGTFSFSATGVSDPGSGVASVTFFYCDSTSSSCTPTAGSSVTGVDGGSGTWTGALNTTGLTDAHTYTWLARAIDGAANQTDTPTRTFIVDNSTPSLSLDAPTVGTSPSSQFYNAAAKTLWLNSSDSGSFSLNATATDAESGIAKVRFSALLGTGATDDLTSPYQSSAYNFAPGHEQRHGERHGLQRRDDRQRRQHLDRRLHDLGRHGCAGGLQPRRPRRHGEDRHRRHGVGCPDRRRAPEFATSRSSTATWPAARACRRSRSA